MTEDRTSVTPATLHRSRTYADLIYAAITRFSDRAAFEYMDRQISYADVERIVLSTITALRARGLGPGDGVAVLCGSRPEAFFTLAAVAVGGFRYTPLHAEGSAADHSYVLDDSEASLLLYDSPRFDAHVEELLGRCPNLHAASIDEFFGEAPTSSDWGRHDVAALLEERRLDDICVLTYTGGTTGRPKGVMRSQRCMATNALYTALEWEWPDPLRFLVMTPLSHGAGWMAPAILLRGGTVITGPSFEAHTFADLLADTRATCTFLVPTMIYRVLDALAPTRRLAGLETVIYGASAMSPSRLAEAIERFGPIFMQLYGQAEAPNLISVLRKHEHVLSTPARLASCGRPVACAEVRLLDSDGRDVADGEVGEICVRGPIVMDGYWKQPELTAEVFRGGWLHTGDLAHRDAEGYLTIVDRAKDMIVTGGLNVFAREVEDVIGEHPGVASVAVIGVPDDDWGEAVKAVVVPRDGAEVSATDLIAFVRARKGPVHAPKSVDFVPALPVTAVGKPDKVALRHRYWPADGGRRFVH